MLDATPTRSSYLSSHSSGSNSPHHQHALSTIRNAIASESQRIRVQDESTGKSYELQLGKEVPYPQHFGDDSEELSIDGSEGQPDASTHGTSTPSRILGSSRSGAANSNSGTNTPRGSPGTPSNGHSTAHRVLRLPLIVKGRSSASGSASTPNGHTSNSSQSTTHSDDANNGNASSTGHSSGSSNPDQAVRLNEVEDKPPKATPGQKQRLQTPPTVPDGPITINGNGNSSNSRPSSDSAADHETKRQGKQNDKLGLKGDKTDAAKRAQAAKGPLQADAKQIDDSGPNVDGLPPFQSGQAQSSTALHGLPALNALDGDAWQAKAKTSPTSIRTNLPRKLNRRQSSYASTSTAYVSADESVNDSGAQTAAEDFDSADEETPTTPIARQPQPMLLRSSPEPSPALLDDQLTDPGGAVSQIGARSSSPRQRRASNSSVETSKASRTMPMPASPLNTSNSTTASYLHPSSAKPGQPPSPSRRNRSVPPRAQPPRRNTTGSSAGSMDSARQRPTSAGGLVGRAASVRRSSRDRWMPGMAPSDQSHDDTSPHSPGPGSGFASQASASGTLRTGDAGFDEELAKAEANVRKRKERAKREEEEKALVAKEAEKNEALERGEKRGGMPGLIRAKSGMGKGGPIAAAAQGPQTATSATREFEEKALVGNIINEGHVNYVLMYNMLTGIRIGVSRCQAKMKRSLRDEDYKAKHKFTFDIIGNELTPSAKYDFKFKDYAPWVFRELREYFHLDPADYLLSLTAKYILSELGSPGKSGSFFYFSRDYRFIIKTIRHSEHKFLRRILKDYHEHVKANPHTLLSRFYGLHRVKLPHGRKIHFVIMNNIFPPHRDIHETYDLKGSSYGREYPEEKAKTKKGATLKDINWVRRRRELELGPEKRALFEAQLASDVALLKRLNIMDYSLLIGLHDMRRGNSENLRQEKLQVVQPESAGAAGADAEKHAAPPSAGHSYHRPHLHHPHGPARPSSATRRGSATTTWSEDEIADAEVSVGSPIPGSSNSNHSIANQAAPTTPGAGPSSLAHAPSKRVSEKDAYALRAAVRRSDAKALGSSSAAQLPARETSERRHFLFEQDEGGFRSTDEENRPGDWIYYLGIIDLFTPYSSVKRGENFWKSLSQDKRMISAVPPKQYGNRFVKFLTAVVSPMKWKDLPPGFEKIEEMKEQQQQQQ